MHDSPTHLHRRIRIPEHTVVKVPRVEMHPTR